MDLLGFLRSYKVPFEDPCNQNYRGVCHCEQDLVLENITSSQINEICGTTYPAGTSLVDMLLESCGSSDDDWRFLSGDTYMDPIFRAGNVSIGGSFNTHTLRVDGTFQFNVSGATLEHSTNFIMRSSTGGYLDLIRPSSINGDTIGTLRFKSGSNEAYIKAIHRGTGDTELSLGNELPAITVSPTGRVTLNQYNSNDSLVNLVGMDSSSVLTRHPINNSPTAGTFLSFNGTGFTWTVPSFSLQAQNGITYGTHVELGGDILRETNITNPSYRFTIGNFSTTTKWSQFVQTNTTNGEASMSAGLGTQRSFALVNKDQARLVHHDGTVEKAYITLNGTSAVLHFDGISITLDDLNIVINGLRVYQNDGAAIADPTLPVNGLFRVTNTNNLHIK